MQHQSTLDEAARIALAVDPPQFVNRRRTAAQTLRNPPVWPVAELNGRPPVLLPAATAKPRGIELAYERKDPQDLARLYPSGSPNGTATHFMPSSMPVFCVSDGEVTYAGKIAHGYALVVDHCNGWATYYSNLEHMFVPPTNRDRRRPVTKLKSGDVLGYIGSMMPGSFKCLHFELWRRDHDGHLVDVDPTTYMSNWLVLPWRQESLTPVESAATDAAA